MREFRACGRALSIVLLLGVACAESDGENSAAATANAAAETDSDIYIAGESGVATFRNLTKEPLFLPGCSPFVFEQSLDGLWEFVGTPFVCVWEGFAVAIGEDERDETWFVAPNESGFYRLRYDYSLGCEPDLPLSQANCASEAVVYSNEFEVERELCEPTQFGCRFVPAAPNFLCADGVNISGPAEECTRDPASGVCGYEFLSCP